MTDGVIVPVGACRCDGAPHTAGDWVELRAEPTIDIGSAVYAAVASYGDDPMALQVEMGRAYLRYGILRWSFTDGHGDPIPITPRKSGFDELVAGLLPFSRGGFEVADKADSLYSEVVLGPLMTRLSLIASQDGQTAGSTSAILRTSQRRAKRSKPSSPAATDGSPSADPGP